VQELGTLTAQRVQELGMMKVLEQELGTLIAQRVLVLVP
jgi:hypothetical protein